MAEIACYTLGEMLPLSIPGFIRMLPDLSGFIAIELVGICSVLYDMNMFPVRLILRIVKSFVRISLFSGIFLVPIVLLVKRNFCIPVLFLALYSFLAWGNLLYMRMFGAIIPFSMYMETQNLNGLSDSIIGLLRGSDIWYVVIPVVIFSVYVLVRKHIYRENPFCHGIGIFVVTDNLYYFLRKKYKITTVKAVAANIAIELKGVYCDLGLLTNMVATAFSSNSEIANSDLSAEEKDIIECHFQANQFYPIVKIDTTVEKKNLVILLMESLNSKALTAKIGDFEKECIAKKSLE